MPLIKGRTPHELYSVKLHEGPAECVVYDVKFKEVKGETKLSIASHCWDREGKEGIVFDNFSLDEKWFWKMRSFFEAIGKLPLLEKDINSDTDLKSIISCLFKANLIYNVNGGREFLNIKNYILPLSAPPSSSSVDSNLDDIQF